MNKDELFWNALSESDFDAASIVLFSALLYYLVSIPPTDDMYNKR